MNGITHRTAGAFAGTLAVKIAFPHVSVSELIIAGSVIGYFGGILPDIDQSNSTVSNMNYLSKLTGYAIHRIFGHRKFFHSILCGLILSFIIFIITGNIFSSPYIAALSFGSGFLSHLLLDMLNKDGIALFYPIKYRFHIASFKSDGFLNLILTGFFSLLLILIYISL